MLCKRKRQSDKDFSQDLPTPHEKKKKAPTKHLGGRKTLGKGRKKNYSPGGRVADIMKFRWKKYAGRKSA